MQAESRSGAQCRVDAARQRRPVDRPPGHARSSRALRWSESSSASTTSRRSSTSIASWRSRTPSSKSAYEELQSTNEELETTNEELQSTVEELETTNEELQSTNEELETMNEELQSTNEELTTINDELRRRSDELNDVNDFMEAVLASLRGGRRRCSIPTSGSRCGTRRRSTSGGYATTRYAVCTS